MQVAFKMAELEVTYPRLARCIPAAAAVVDGQTTAWWNAGYLRCEDGKRPQSNRRANFVKVRGRFWKRLDETKVRRVGELKANLRSIGSRERADIDASALQVILLR
jgi:hypothetical protein